MDIDLWHWSITPHAAASGRLEEVFGDVLDGSELARAGRFHEPRDGLRFANARRGVRIVLGRVLSCSPRDVRFGSGEYGKPFVFAPVPRDGRKLYFNLSHSGDLAVLALSRNVEVGVDIERVRDIDLRMARRFFTAREADAVSDPIAAAPVDQSRAAFFRIWTAKEAVVKASGEGIRRGLDTFEFDALADDRARVVPAGDRVRPPLNAQVAWFVPGEGYTGAVAAITADEPIGFTLRALSA